MYSLRLLSICGGSSRSFVNVRALVLKKLVPGY